MPTEIRPRWSDVHPTQAPNRAPERDGWFPQVSPDGRFVAYGFRVAQYVDLVTGAVRDVLPDYLPAGRFLRPMGWWGAETFLVRDLDNGQLFRVHAPTGTVDRLPVAPELAVFNDASASAGHWGGVRRQNPNRLVLDGVIMVGTDHLLCSLAGHFAATQAADGKIRRWRHPGVGSYVLEATITPQQPNANEFVVGEDGTVSYGYYSSMRLCFLDGRDVNATVTPGAGSESVAALPLLNGQLWLWQGAELAGLGVVIGRDWHADGTAQAILLDRFPCVSITAAFNGTAWVVAGCSARGELQVAFVDPAAVRQKLVGTAPATPPPAVPTMHKPEVTVLTWSDVLKEGSAFVFFDRENPQLGTEVRVWVENGSVRHSIAYKALGPDYIGSSSAYRPIKQ